MADQDLMALYSQRILALTTQIPHVTPLEDNYVEAYKRAPLCGSHVRVRLRYENDQVVAFSQDVKACALGQAAAAVLGRSVLGMSLENLTQGRDQLRAMLKNEGAVPQEPFDELEVLLPAKAYKNRHASVLLAFDATVDAIEQTQAAAS